MKRKLTQLQFDSMFLALVMIAENKGAEAALYELRRIKDRIEITQEDYDFIEKTIEAKAGVYG